MLQLKVGRASVFRISFLFFLEKEITDKYANSICYDVYKDLFLPRCILLEGFL
jgi:hypothetical protein